MSPKAVELHLLNPPRRRRRHGGRHRRRMSALQAKYFGGGRRRTHRRRNAITINPRRSHRRHRLYAHHRRHARRNPVGQIGAIITKLAKDAGIATLGIQANNLIGNTVAKSVLGVSGVQRSAVKVGTAVTLGTLVSMFMPRYREAACYAASAAVALEATKFLNSTVIPLAPTALQDSLSMSDGVSVPAPAKVGRLSYNSRVRYLPGGSYAELPTVGARINRYGQPNVMSSGGYSNALYDPSGESGLY